MALGWVAVSLLLVVNKPEDLGYEGEDTVANAMKKKEKGTVQKKPVLSSTLLFQHRLVFLQARLESAYSLSWGGGWVNEIWRNVLAVL